MAVVEAQKQAATFAERTTRSRTDYLWSITGLSLLLGGMLATALHTQGRVRSEDLPATRFATLAPLYSDLKRSNDQLLKQLRELQIEKTRYEQQLAQGSGAAAALNKELQALKFQAGLLPVKGPGIIITIEDSQQRLPVGASVAEGTVHDYDLNAILSELKAAGAEALAIAGADTGQAQRVTALTTVRCAGPGMKVNDAHLGGPYTIYAIGNPAELESQLRLRGGVLDQTGMLVLKMVAIQRREEIVIPAATDAPTAKHARPS
jgi:uncharacterized protein YlxW (UPF0749 family)